MSERTLLKKIWTLLILIVNNMLGNLAAFSVRPATVVCPICIAKIHQKHDLEEISETYDKKILMMKNRKIQLQREQDKMNQQKIRLKQLKTAKTSKYNTVDQDILDQGKKLECYIEKIRKELQEHQNDVLQSINSELDNIEKKTQQCEDQASKTEHLIKTTDVTMFFEEVEEIKKLSDKSFTLQIHPIYHLVPIFIPGEITQSNVGMLQSDKKLQKTKLNAVKEFKTEIPLVHHVSPCSDDSVWICNLTAETLQKVKPKGNNLKTLSSYKIKVYGMALTPNDDLLLAIAETRLKQIKNSTETIQDSNYNTDPFITTCVHVSQDYKVMVGGITDRRQVVIIMDQTGEQLTMYEEDREKQPLFTYPKAITSTNNHNVFVADYDPDDGYGRLVILDQTGDVQYYTGHPELNKDKAFVPVHLIATPNDNVIVVDFDTNSLHIFDNSGQLMTLHYTKNKGIQYPYSLGFSLSGHFYVGCSRAKGSEDNAKLYLVNISCF